MKNQLECYAKLCIYNKNDRCTLGTTSINVCGMCEEFIFVDIPEKILKRAKDISLGEIVHYDYPNFDIDDMIDDD